MTHKQDLTPDSISYSYETTFNEWIEASEYGANIMRGNLPADPKPFFVTFNQIQMLLSCLAMALAAWVIIPDPRIGMFVGFVSAFILLGVMYWVAADYKRWLKRNFFDQTNGITTITFNTNGTKIEGGDTCHQWSWNHCTEVKNGKTVILLFMSGTPVFVSKSAIKSEAACIELVERLNQWRLGATQ